MVDFDFGNRIRLVFFGNGIFVGISFRFMFGFICKGLRLLKLVIWEMIGIMILIVFVLVLFVRFSVFFVGSLFVLVNYGIILRFCYWVWVWILCILLLNRLGLLWNWLMKNVLMWVCFLDLRIVCVLIMEVIMLFWLMFVYRIIGRLVVLVKFMLVILLVCRLILVGLFVFFMIIRLVFDLIFEKFFRIFGSNFVFCFLYLCVCMVLKCLFWMIIWVFVLVFGLRRIGFMCIVSGIW